MLQSGMFWALVASGIYGVMGPLMKYTMSNGATSLAVIISYGVACTALPLLVNSNAAFTFGDWKNGLLVGFVGTILAIAFYAVGQAFALPGSSHAHRAH